MHPRKISSQCFLTDSCFLQPWRDDQNLNVRIKNSTKRRSFSQFSSALRQRTDSKMIVKNQVQPKSRIYLIPNKIMIPADCNQILSKTDTFKNFKSFMDCKDRSTSAIGFTNKSEYRCKQRLQTSYSALDKNKIEFNIHSKSPSSIGLRNSKKILTNKIFNRRFNFNFFTSIKNTNNREVQNQSHEVAKEVNQKPMPFVKYCHYYKNKSFKQNESNKIRCQTQG